MKNVMVFTPVLRLEAETVEAVFDLEWDGPLSVVFQRDNPHAGGGRLAGVKNHLHQYERGRELFLSGDYEALLVIESDIIPPKDALRKLAALECDVAYGVYVFRGSQVVNVFEAYPRPSRNPGESLSVIGQWPPVNGGAIECSGGGLGCVLIKRHVLEKVPFRVEAEQWAHCDSTFTADCWQAGFSMRADTTLRCGHMDALGVVWWPS